MGKDKKLSEKLFYAISKGKRCGIFKQWSQAKPLVDKFPGAAYKGFNTLNDAVNFMILGDIQLPDILIFEDTENGQGEAVLTFANRNAIALQTGLVGASNTNLSNSSDGETEEKFVDAHEFPIIHIDGCCLNNGNGSQSRAGIGVYWGQDHTMNVSEPLKCNKKTNNTAEISAAIRALEQVKEQNLQNVLVKSDSKYVVDGITKWMVKWKTTNWLTNQGTDVENKELWIRLDVLNDQTKPRWQHIPRELNSMADRLAKEGADADVVHITVESQGQQIIQPQSVSCCVICSQEASFDVLACSSCSKKVHVKCSGLPQYQISVFRKSNRKFSCEVCVLGAGNLSVRRSVGEKEAEVNHQSKIESESVQISPGSSEEFKSLKEDIASVKSYLGNFESEILRVITQLRDENVQMKEKMCEERVKVCEKEKQEVSLLLQKVENREKDLKVQLDNLRDKNAKLANECDNLRSNISRHKETEVTLNNRICEKDEMISKLRSEIVKSSKRPTDSPKKSSMNNQDVHVQSVDPGQNNDVQCVSTVMTKNRFVNDQRTPVQNHQERNPNAVHVRDYKDPLSTFYRMSFKSERKEFNSIEQAFQYIKALRHRDERTAQKVMRAKHAGIANKIGREVRIHPQWDKEKEAIMYQLLSEKTEQSAAFRNELKKTGEKDIQVDIRDKFWGIGPDGNGHNVLGKMLQDLRREIKNHEMKPKVAIIGSSIVKNLRGDRFSRDFLTRTHRAYTIPEAEVTLRDSKESADVIVYQLLSNDMKVKSEEECLSNLANLVTKTKQSHPGAKIIVSLPPNRGDSAALNCKTNTINAGVKSHYRDDQVVTVCDNSNLAYRGEPDGRYICSDGVHPTPEGERILFRNIRQSINAVLRNKVVKS
ncbi:hypothetical protein FSP39_019889 [Pinctada imbricata]|uniref:ribonuclease H n=1 Tax=Pinctada imbricata TaxID=66713 RepID=A0AA88YEX0_PINIB|nr:hypothetical protein FSP39_019889 [Pinctada imbricata]